MCSYTCGRYLNTVLRARKKTFPSILVILLNFSTPILAIFHRIGNSLWCYLKISIHFPTFILEKYENLSFLSFKQFVKKYYLLKITITYMKTLNLYEFINYTLYKIMFRTNHLGKILPINCYLFLFSGTQFIVTQPNNPTFHRCSKKFRCPEQRFFFFLLFTWSYL